jgi:hypothetical protein
MLPKRLAPVCRDRSDLLSPADLTENVKDALRHPESLIVICSPRAPYRAGSISKSACLRDSAGATGFSALRRSSALFSLELVAFAI